MNKKIFVLCFIFIAGPTPRLFAGAWTREKGEAYIKANLSHFTSDQIYRHNKDRKMAGPDLTDNSLSLYGEYGVTPSWTAVVSVESKFLVSKASGTKTTESGLSDLWLYGKKKLISNPFVMSMQFGLKIPLGYNEDRIPPLGEGQFDWEERVLVGKSLYPFPGYLNAELAFRKRMGDYSDVLPYVLEAGVNLRKNLLLKLSVNGISNLTNDKASELAAPRKPNVFDKEYMKFTPSLIFTLREGLFLEGYYETFIHGANTAAGDTIGFAVAWQGKIKK